MRQLLRVSIAGPDRRADLAVMGDICVAELLPDLATAVGLPARGSEGHRLVGPTGQVFRGEIGLGAQGVRDGLVLSLVAPDEVSRMLFDDPVEEMAEAVKETCLPWHHTVARPAALAAGALALAMGLGALLLGDRPWIGSATLAVATALVLAATALDRLRHEGLVALLAGWAGIAYSAAGGELLGGPAPAGAAAAVAGIVLARALTDRWLLVLPAVAAGGVLAVLGILESRTSLDTGFLAAVALAATVVVAPGLPAVGLALAESGLAGGARSGELAQTVASGHDVLRSLQGTAGLLALVLIPAIVHTGWAGSLLAMTASVLSILRARHHHSAAEVALGAGFGVAGLTAAAASVLLFRPEWAGCLGMAAAGVGLLVPAWALGCRQASPRSALMLDHAESLLLIALLPLLVVSAGVIEVLRGLSLH
jgi:hypothetical protein